ncbi:MAG: hypothetical protein J7M26_04870, partial [Armatimonadetes bacterium]|nr:hypothetical protein [Armatimonadota bacterium]
MSEGRNRLTRWAVPGSVVALSAALSILALVVLPSMQGGGTAQAQPMGGAPGAAPMGGGGPGGPGGGGGMPMMG